jgi:hypothetical protein
VLFDLVRLQPGDSVPQLQRLGMKLRRKTTKPWFPQPCQFLKNGACEIYEHRPTRCRLFECQQLRRLKEGETTEQDASAMIGLARRMVADIEALLPPLALGSQPPTLGERVSAALEEKPDLKLQRLHNRLKRLLDREFRVLG